MDGKTHSTPSQSNSSGKSSRGCTPPLVPSSHSALELSPHSRSGSPSNKSRHKSSVGNLNKLESAAVVIPTELNTSLTDSHLSCSASSSTKPHSKFSHHPSSSSIISNGSEKRKKEVLGEKCFESNL